MKKYLFESVNSKEVITLGSMFLRSSYDGGVTITQYNPDYYEKEEVYFGSLTLLDEEYCGNPANTWYFVPARSVWFIDLETLSLLTELCSDLNSGKLIVVPRINDFVEIDQLGE